MSELLIELFSEEITPNLQINSRTQIKKIFSEEFYAVNLTYKDIEKRSPMALNDPCTPGNPKKTTLDDMRLMYQYSIEGKLFN